MALNQLKFDQLETGSVYPITASYALSSSAGSGGTTLITGSLYPITSSWSNYSISSSYSVSSSNSFNSSTSSFSFNSTSASYSSTASIALNALTASYLDPISQSLIPSTGSVYSLGSPTNKWKDLYVSTGSIYIGETVLSTSGSTLFANSSPVVTLNTASGQLEVSGLTASLSSSYSDNSGLFNNTSSTVFATTGSNIFNGNQTVQGNITVVGSLIAQQYVVSSSVSYFTSSNFDGSTKFGDTESDIHQFTGSLRSPNITGSLLGTSSIALIALTSSYINVATNAISSSFANTASVSISSSYSSYAITSSYSLTSVSSSYSNVANTATSATNANTATSSSYATTAGTATSATSANSANTANTATSSSFASNATSSSFATTAGNASSANSATSASYSLSSSYSVNSNTSISSSFASTASYNLNSISSSYSLTASYSLNGGSGGASLTTGSSYPITSSWATNATTASYALNSAGGGGSISYITGSPVIAQYIVVSGSGTTQYTLTQSVSNPEHLLVSVNGVVQNYSSSYTVTGSTINFYQPYSDGDEIDVRFLNGGTTVQTGSIAGQTILYNFSSSQESTLTGLNLTGNKWGVNVIEEWNSGSGDIYFNSCSLLLHFSGSNNSTTFIDSSPNNFTVTSNNGAKITSSISKFGGTSGFFDGTDDYLSTPNTVSNFSTDDFTIECWFYKVSTNSTLISNCTATNTDNNYFAINAGTDYAVIQIRDNSGQAFAYGPSTTSNQWNHIAVTRNSGTVTVFVNGVSGTPVSITKTITSRLTIIGGFLYTGFEGYFYGYIDELRITKGVARYTTNFTTQSVQFPDSLPQYETKYIGLIGGLNDTGSDYGVQKLDDTSLKIRKMSVSGTPVSGSPILSASVDRVYVNVLNYDNVSISGSISNAVTASYALTASYAVNSLDIPKIKSIIYTNSSYTPTTASAVDLVIGNNYIIISGSNFKSSASVFIDATTGSIVNYINENQLNVNVATKAVGTYPIYLMNTDGASTFKINAITYITGLSGTQKAIFGYGYTNVNVSMTNLVSNTGTVATDTTGVGTNRSLLAAAGYGTDKAIFGYGDASGVVSMTNLVSNTGVVATNTTGVGTARYGLAAAGYGTDKAIFGYGYTGAYVSMTNLVNNTGVVATDTTGVGTGRFALAAAGYGSDKAIFGYGWTGAYISLTNLVSNTGVVATDTTGVGTGRYQLAAAGYGTDKAIFGYGYPTLSMTNLVNNTGVVATDTTGVGTARHSLAAAGYGGDKAIFGYGLTSGVVSMTNLVNNTGVVATDTTGVGTAREGLAAAGYSTS